MPSSLAQALPLIVFKLLVTFKAILTLLQELSTLLPSLLI
jgi:hypothetical protein